MNRRSRLTLQFFALLALSSLIHRFGYQSAKVRIARQLREEKCRLFQVRSLDLTACNKHNMGLQGLDAPCRWHIEVHNEKWPQIRLLSPSRVDKYQPEEVTLLRELDGCDSGSSCKNESLPCIYGIEDPSDVLWLRDYNQGSKFVVMVRICMASLLFFLVSILCDGSFFYPHRPGTFSIPAASLLALLAFASLLYLIIVPPHLQLSLYGEGFWQTTGYIFLILMIAGTLPGMAVAWINFCLFAIYFLGFLVEQLVLLVVGVLHYLGALAVYQAQSTFHRLRLIYYRGAQNEADSDRRLLDFSQRFLERVRGNVFLYRVSNALEQDSLQVVESTLSDYLFDELLRESVPQVDFESLEEHNRESDTSQADVTTPLLQRNAAT